MQPAHPTVNALFGQFQKGILGLGGVIVHWAAGELFVSMTDYFVGGEILADHAIGC
jgi:hypothetical protein